MLNSDIKWFYPKTIEETVDLLRENIRPHAGGTAILRSKSNKINGMVDLHKVESLRIFQETEEAYHVGAMLTFSEVCEKIGDKDFILNQALGIAASTLLRNRITIGGSIADAPPWSDLLGGLLILDGRVELQGENSGIFSVKEVIDNKGMLNKSLITKAILPKKFQKYGFYRCIRVNFDYASFTLSIGANITEGKFDALSMLVFGSKRRYQRLSHVESALVGKKLDKELVFGALEQEDLDFIDDEKGSGEYLRQLLKTHLYRKLEALG